MKLTETYINSVTSKDASYKSIQLSSNYMLVVDVQNMHLFERLVNSAIRFRGKHKDTLILDKKGQFYEMQYERLGEYFVINGFRVSKNIIFEFLGYAE